MIVTCERCATQFQLDDERVSEDGVRVRCSRCKHAFFIERPARNEAEKIHRIARRALEDTPAPAQDLPGGREPAESLDEEDWQFADDAPFGAQGDDGAGALDTAAATHAVDDLLVGPGDAGDDEGVEIAGKGVSVTDLLGSDFAEEEESLSLADEDLAPEPAAQDESLPLASEEGFEIGAEPAEPAPLAEEDDAASLLADLRDELGGDPAPPAPVPEPAPAPRRERVTAPTRTVTTSQAPDELSALESWALDDESEAPTVATGLEVPSAPALRVPAEVEEAPSAQARWLGRAGNFAGWACVLALLAVGLHGGVAVRGPAIPAASTAVQVGGFELSQVDTSWIDNLHVGPLLVISGTLRNEAAAEGTALVALLLGPDGERIDGARVAVGPALGESLLRGAPPQALGEAQRRLRRDGWPWQRGEERRFLAVTRSVPDGAVWVRFEAIENGLTR